MTIGTPKQVFGHCNIKVHIYTVHMLGSAHDESDIELAGMLQNINKATS
jgi:hypothetical protein